MQPLHFALGVVIFASFPIGGSIYFLLHNSARDLPHSRSAWRSLLAMGLLTFTLSSWIIHAAYSVEPSIDGILRTHPIAALALYVALLIILTSIIYAATNPHRRGMPSSCPRCGNRKHLHTPLCIRCGAFLLSGRKES